MQRLSRKLIPIRDYKKTDPDGWSGLVIGLRIRDGKIADLRMGYLFEDMFYDLDGGGFPATHLLVLKESDLIVGKSIGVKKGALWSPSKEQINALSKVVRMMPWEDRLKGLLRDIKSI